MIEIERCKGLEEVKETLSELKRDKYVGMLEVAYLTNDNRTEKIEGYAVHIGTDINIINIDKGPYKINQNDVIGLKTLKL